MDSVALIFECFTRFGDLFKRQVSSPKEASIGKSRTKHINKGRTSTRAIHKGDREESELACACKHKRLLKNCKQIPQEAIWQLVEMLSTRSGLPP